MADGMLSAADIIVVFADLQEGIVNVGSTNEPQRMRAAVAALTDLALAFDLPVTISCVPTTGGTVAPLLSEITDRMPRALPLVRTTSCALDDAAFRTALDATGRKTLVVAGVATEVTVRLAALAATRNGFHTIVAVDACNGLDARTESATFMQLVAAGVELSTVATVAAQLAGDFRSASGRAAMRVLQATLPQHAHDHDAL